MPNNLWFAMRVDASIDMGSGHLMRCLTLAGALIRQGFRGFLLSVDLPEAFHDVLNKHGIFHIPLITGDDEACVSEHNDRPYYHSHWLKHSESYDIELSRRAIQKLSLEMGCSPVIIVVDHYALGEPWEQALGQDTSIFAIDDLNDRPHSTRWLLDQNAGKTQLDYQGLVKEDTHLLVGSDYALLREEFACYRRQAVAKRQELTSVRNILVTLGGSDQNNITGKILACLDDLDISDDIIVDVVIGGVNPNEQCLRELCATLSYNVRLSVAVDDMAERMLNADFCIGAAGATAWERCAMGLPAINVVLAENQRTIAKNLSDAGAAFTVESEGNNFQLELFTCVVKLLSESNTRKNMSQCALSLCDGQGVQRVVEAILDEY